METVPSTPTLLGIPRELRDLISSHLTAQANTRKPPPSPPFAGKRTRGSDDIMYPADRTSARFPMIAFGNRQLWCEARENAFLSTAKPKVELDLMAKGYTFYPTFTHLPSQIRRDRGVDLTVNLRIFSTEAFRSNDGWPRQAGAGFRTLLALLNSFLRYGPPLMPSRHTVKNPTPFHIDTLFVNVTFHDLYTPDTWARTSAEVLRVLKGLAFSGVPSPFIKLVKADVHYENRIGSLSVSKEWPVAQHCKPWCLDEWNRDGFRFLPRSPGSQPQETE
ncbi:hypothetical protein LTR36_000371 [Oleoguttula mirabilis]|uniref:Uncharacterized protein n=1 Tax=Oleoguttula mirabilis TaxID=1507867 RepID=A0AAV9K086_9PEZI|nr:hypothetical protein LTR36_000371 [Oleoguttula mirabilis]